MVDTFHPLTITNGIAVDALRPLDIPSSNSSNVRMQIPSRLFELLLSLPPLSQRGKEDNLDYLFIAVTQSALKCRKGWQ